jgi:ADP-dependent NAD(P)H-hydrate dehydratase / NAD(P)H-hydrate epimerase
MQPLLSADQMQKVDRGAISEIGIPELVLMEHAALGLVSALETRFGSLLVKTRGVIVAGTGNNGGDVLAATRILHEKGMQNLFVALIGSEKNLSPSTKQQLQILGKLGIAWGKEITPELVQASDWILDGLFGTGLNREVEGDAKHIIALLNEAHGRKWIVAADIPSGLSAETGIPMGTAVKASETVTFGFIKRGLVTGKAAEYVGRLHLAPIQIPRDLPFVVDTFLYTEEDAARLPYRKPTGHKGTFGHVYVWAGRQEKEGAGILSATGALRSGAGLVSLIGDSSDLESARGRSAPELMLVPATETFFMEYPGAVVVLGPGLGLGEKRWTLIQKALESDAILVLDADAITLLSENAMTAKKLLSKRRSLTFCTPHPKEAARMLGTTVEKVEANRFEAIEALTTQWKCHLILKGKGTLVRPPQGPTIAVGAGNTALSKGGTGDLLSGILASFLAQQMRPEHALPLAVYVHGRASEILSQQAGTERTAQATDIAQSLTLVFSELEKWK